MLLNQQRHCYYWYYDYHVWFSLFNFKSYSRLEAGSSKSTEAKPFGMCEASQMTFLLPN